MVEGQNLIPELALDAVSVTNAGTGTSQNIDTMPNGVKASYLTLPVWGTTSNVASNVPTVLKLQECDTTVDTSFTDIVPFVGGTATSATVGFLIPTAFATATSQLPYAMFMVNLLPRKRYIRLKVSPVTSQTFTSVAILSRSEIAPSTLAGYNISGVIVTG